MCLHLFLPKKRSHNQLSVKTQASFHTLFFIFGWDVRGKNANPGQTTWHFFFHRTIFILPSINNEIAFTGNSFLHNGYPALNRAVETRRISFPIEITIDCILHYTLQRLIPHGPQKDEAQVHCLRNHARPVCSAQQRKLICNLRWRQLNLSLLPLKRFSA